MVEKYAPRQELRRTSRAIITAAAAIPMLVALVVAFGAVRAIDPAVTVSMTATTFTPQEISVYVGEDIRWLNTSANPHTVTSDAPEFHSGAIAVGADYVRSFSAPGVVDYYCTFHAGMVGKINVLADGSPLPPTPTPTTSGGGPSGGTAVDIIDDGYTPSPLTLPVGSTITWTNTGARAHTVTDNGGAFHSGLLAAGATYSRTFDAPGTIDYYCTIHGGMTGTLIISGDPPPGSTSTPPGTASPTSSATATPTSSATATPTAPPPPPPPGSEQVSMTSNLFTPASRSITTGTTVTWLNNQGFHNAKEFGGAFNSPDFMATGTTFSFAFLTAGTYTYYCSLHAIAADASPANIDASIAAGKMVGKVIVTGASVPTPAGATATPTRTPTPTAVPPPPGAKQVQVIDFGYLPENVTIKPGETVAWKNVGAIPHTVTATKGLFNSNYMGTGDTFQFKFPNAGIFSYYCVYHPGMTGSVIVATASGQLPTPEPTSSAEASDPIVLPTPAPGSALVRVIDNDFIPRSLAIDAGTKVTWFNEGGAPHTASDQAGVFDSGLLGRGGSFSYTFTAGGTYVIDCLVHPGMTSSITVKGSAGGSAPPKPSGTPTATPTPLPPPAPGAVQMLDFDFAPKSLTVRVGANVTWVNVGKAPHTVTAMDGLFDSGMKLTGGTFAFDFDTPGTYPYYCILHPGMVGEVVVTNAAGEAPPPADTPPAPRSTIAPSSPVPPAGPNGVSMLDNTFSPATLTIRAGSTVQWVNAGQVPHTATASDSSFDSGFVNRGGSFSRTFATPGTYDYVCILHPGMAGRIVATDAAGSAPPPAPTPTPAPSVVGTTNNSTSNGQSSSRPLEMLDFDYAPREYEVQSGAEIRWINNGAAPHTVTARNGSFDSGIVMAKGEFTFKAGAPGTYDYYCILHPQMVGKLIVTAAGPGAGGPAAGPDSGGAASPNLPASQLGGTSSGTPMSGAITFVVLMAAIVIGLVVKGVAPAIARTRLLRR